MQALSIRHVKKTFDGVPILNGINIDVEAGQFLILVGPSGCGKSTLLNCIAGLETVSSGEIWIGGRMVNDLAPKDRDIAMVFQSYALYPSMSVRDNIAFGLKMRKVPVAERTATIARVAKILQIEALLDRKPGQLSGGQRQRVAMGRALARNPGLFLFDEPLSNLDAKLRVEMRAEIKLLHQRTRTTSIYVTHDQIEAMTLGDCIAVMKDGMVQQFGSPLDIYERPANLFVAGFIGSPSMNFIPVTVQSQGDDALITLQSAEGEQRWILPNVQDPSQSSRQLTLGLRPEAIQRSNDAARTLPVQIQIIEHTGSDAYFRFLANGVPCVGRCEPHDTPQPGEVIAVTVDLRKAVLFDPATGLKAL